MMAMENTTLSMMTGSCDDTVTNNNNDTSAATVNNDVEKKVCLLMGTTINQSTNATIRRITPKEKIYI